MMNVVLPTTKLVAAFSAKLGLHGMTTVESKHKVLKTYVNEILWQNFGIEVPVFLWRGELAMRISLPVYVSMEDLHQLCRVVLHLCQFMDDAISSRENQYGALE
jgi:hypothetical protein